MRRAPASSKALSKGLWRQLLLAAMVAVCLPLSAWAQVCGTPGKDGPASSLSGVINTYYPGAATASSGSTSITLGASRLGGASTSIAVGDLLLVIQMQDAAINTTNGTAYGANNGTGRGATAINNSGLYEYVVATSSLGTGGGTVSIRGAGAGNGLVNTYTDADATAAQGQRSFQVLRVPQYSSATLTSGLTAAQWDGSTGGVLAFDVAGILNLGSATVNVNGLGFRGGGGRALIGGRASSGVARPTNTDYVYFSSTPVTSTAGAHGGKGEGIAGTPRYVFDPVTSTIIELSPTAEGYPGGANARGAPGNAGGGGTDSDGSGVNQENSGGGGGGNGGVGGAGGNTWSGNAATGGIGGAQVANAANRVMMGGGGGAGSRNNSVNYDSSGASGGGIVLIRAGTVSGSATITANGNDAWNNTANDGGGGGGAGGSVIVSATGSLSGLTIRARGGRGGDAWRTGGTTLADRHGPGGGGAGGFIAQTGGASTDVTGGSHGVTTTLADAYGSTDGASGSLLSITQAQIPGIRSGAQCIPDLTVTKTTSTASVTNTSSGTTATYSITVVNAASVADATQVNVSDALPTNFTYASTGSVTLSGGATRPSTTNPTAGDTNPNWGVFTIPASGQVRITFTVNIARAVVSGTYQNPATATSLDATRTTANGTTTDNYNSASSTGEDVTVTSTPDLTIAKSHTGNFTQGQTGATYTVTATNSGAGQTSGTVTVTDTLPASLAPTAASGTGWTCSISTQTVTCTRSDALVAPNSYPAITVTVNVSQSAPASVTNTASVSGGGETNTGNDSASDATTINQFADLTIAKSHTGNFTQGQTNASYTLTATNSGNAATSGTVTVTDTLPTGLSYSSATGTGWSCSASGQTVTCTRSDALAAGASYPAITLNVNVAANAASSVTNSASISGGGEIITTNDSASDATTINQVADLTITKSHTGNFTQGQSGSYTITVTNSGTGATAGTVTVTDTLPTGLSYSSATGTGWTCSASGQTVTCTRSDVLAASASYPAITLNVNVAANSPFSVTNSVTVSGGGEVVTSNDTATDATTVNGVPDMTIAKSHTGNFTQGQTGATYTITATNSGTAASTGTVTVTDTLPASLSPQSASGTGWSCSISSQTVTCTRSDALAASSSYPNITVTVNVSATAPASVTNTASVSGGGETNTGNDSASDATTINQLADLTIAKSHTGNFTQGQTGATYTLTVTNSGNGSTSGTVTVTDTLPASLTSPVGSGTGWTCSTSGQTVTCTRATVLAAGASYPAITITVNVSATAPSSVTNTASVSGGGEIITNNDSASDATTINAVADMTISKTHTGNFTRGSTGTYTITATNSGSVATNGTTVTVTDTLPAGLTPTAASGTGWTCSISTQTVTCTRSNALAAGASYPAISVTVSVAQGAASSITNTASVSGGGQANTANDTASDATTIVSSADLSLTKVTTSSGSGVGTNATFTITLTNSGPSDATNVAVKDQLPAGLSYVSSTPSVGSYNSGTGIWTVASLASGSSATLQIVAQITSLGSITNTAQVTASDQPDPDSTPNNNNAAEDDQASASLSTSPPNITLCKTIQGQPCPPVASTSLSPGSDITYVITFTNTGGSYASSFVITDPVPASTDFKVGSVTNNLGTTGLTVTVAYSNNNGTSWVYTPVSGGGGAPAGYDRNVTHVRWAFTGNLSQTSPNNTGNVGFTVRIR